MSRRTPFLGLLVALSIAACSGGGSAATPARSAATSGGGGTSGGGTASTAPATAGGGGSSAAASATSAAPSLPPTFQPGTGGGPLVTFAPSGGKVRIANLYTNGGTPTDIDVYGGYSATGGTLLTTIPYGTISDWFDPGKLDDQGDIQVTFYPKGKTDRNEQLGSQSETFQGGELITIAVGEGDNRTPANTSFARWRTTFESKSDYPVPTSPTAGTAVLQVDGIGLGATFPGSKETFGYVGVDGTCLPSVDMGTAGGAQPNGPQTVVDYIAPGGAHDLTWHLTNPDCKGASVYDKTHYDVAAGGRAYVFLFSPDGKQLKTLVVPVSQ